MNPKSEDKQIEQMLEKNPLGVFDKKNLFNLNEIIKEVDILQNGVRQEHRLTREQIDNYIQNEILPEFHTKDGTRVFPSYSGLRLIFINEIAKKWNYDNQKLKYIADVEERFICDVLAGEELDYSELSPYDFYITWLKGHIEENRSYLQFIHNDEYGEELAVKVETDERLLHFLMSKKFDELTKTQQQKVIAKVIHINWVFEISRTSQYFEFQSQILLGFSPFVTFINKAMFPSEMPANIDRRKYPYVYEAQFGTFAFGDWEYSEYDEFFATPEFLIESDDENRIIITIRDPNKVESKYMRRIEKVYNCFRKRINPSKAKWGEKKGRKELYKERNKKIREYYQKLRHEKPKIAARRHIDKIDEMVEDQFESRLSYDTIKRIIYTKD